MLGSAVDAEDVVQETWLRWADVERSTVPDARACLALSLNRLRAIARRREEYVAADAVGWRSTIASSSR